MYKVILSVVLLVTHFCSGEQPLSICSKVHPFKTKENTCANFAEICIKRGDDECDVLQKACSQCPPSNYSVIVFLDVQYLKFEMNRTTLSLNKLSGKMKSMQKTLSILIILVISTIALVSILMIINFVLGPILVKKKATFYRRTRLLLDETDKGKEDTVSTTFYPRISNAYSSFRERLLLDETDKGKEDTVSATSYPRISNAFFSLRERPLLEETDKGKEDTVSATSYPKINSLSSFRERLLSDETDIVKEDTVSDSESDTAKVRFLIDGLMDSIDLNVNSKDNVVKIKKDICAKWKEAPSHYFKIMRLSHNGLIIDDNKKLLPKIILKNKTVECEIDHSLISGDIIVLKLNRKLNLPKLIQINKNNTIGDLKNILCDLDSSIDLKSLIIMEDASKCEPYEDQTTIESCKLKDNDRIRVIQSENGKLRIKSIFEEGDALIVDYSNMDQIKLIKKNLAYKFNTDLQNFVLFFNKDLLDEEEFIFNTKIGMNDELNYFFFKKLDIVSFQDTEPFEKGYFSELFHATYNTTKREIILKKYTSLSADLKEDIMFVQELVTFLTTKSNPRFIQLYDIFKDDQVLYIAEERVDGKSLKSFIKGNHPLKQEAILSISRQILECLAVLHKSGITFRDLKPSNILVDENSKLKLPSFSLSKYVYDDDSKMKSTNAPLRYLAPEILMEKKFGNKVDVWSFGMIVIEMTTGGEPYKGLTEEQAKQRIIKIDKTGYNLSSLRHKEFTGLINHCIKFDPKERPTISDLQKEKLFQIANQR